MDIQVCSSFACLIDKTVTIRGSTATSEQLLTNPQVTTSAWPIINVGYFSFLRDEVNSKQHVVSLLQKSHLSINRPLFSVLSVPQTINIPSNVSYTFFLYSFIYSQTKFSLEIGTFPRTFIERADLL